MKRMMHGGFAPASVRFAIAASMAARCVPGSEFRGAFRVEGDWQGMLQAGGVELQLILHILKGDNGARKVTLDSVDQGANGIPVTSVSFNKRFEVDEMPGLNHLFQTPKTRSPKEYAEIEEAMSQVASEKIASCILAR